MRPGWVGAPRQQHRPKETPREDLCFLTPQGFPLSDLRGPIFRPPPLCDPGRIHPSSLDLLSHPVMVTCSTWCVQAGSTPSSPSAARTLRVTPASALNSQGPSCPRDGPSSLRSSGVTSFGSCPQVPCPPPPSEHTGTAHYWADPGGQVRAAHGRGACCLCGFLGALGQTTCPRSPPGILHLREGV